jgi:hypothetical protein
MVVTIKSAIFWIVPSCNSETARRFGGTYHLHIQADSLPPDYASFLLELLFEPEGEDDMFL